MTKPVCLTTALPFADAAPGAEPPVDGLEMRVVRGQSAASALTPRLFRAPVFYVSVGRLGDRVELP